MWRRFFELIAILSFAQIALNNIVIETPASLKNEIWDRHSKLPKKRTQGFLEYSTGDFGKIDFSKKSKMKVVVQPYNLKGCAPFDPIAPQSMPFAMLIQRGDCTFSMKTHHAYTVPI